MGCSLGGVFNFIAFHLFGLHVADTVGKGIVDITIIDSKVIFATLMGACLWDIFTWYFGLPTSSSHALMGGLIGAAIVKAGSGSLVLHGIIKTVSFIFISPALGLFLGLFIGVIVYRAFRRYAPMQVDHIFRKGQLVSAAFYSLGHGGNDAQKTMGIIASLLFSEGLLGDSFYIPLWVVLTCQAAIALGTMFGGWRIVKTMGQKISKLRPVDGFCAEFGAAATFFLVAYGNPGKHNAHNNRRYHGSRFASAPFCGKMGCRGSDRVGLDIDDSLRCRHVRGDVLSGAVIYNVPHSLRLSHVP